VGESRVLTERIVVTYLGLKQGNISPALLAAFIKYGFANWSLHVIFLPGATHASRTRYEAYLIDMLKPTLNVLDHGGG
jgi:hypothetical protein